MRINKEIQETIDSLISSIKSTPCKSDTVTTADVLRNVGDIFYSLFPEYPEVRDAFCKAAEKNEKQ